MKKKILLIDDDATYLFLVKKQLEKHLMVGEIVTAANGLEALEILKRDHEAGELPQVIISDIKMPVMGGITFSKELERLKLVDYAATKVVLNSSRVHYSKLDWSTESPTIEFFPKPLTQEQLLTILAD